MEPSINLLIACISVLSSKVDPTRFNKLLAATNEGIIFFSGRSF